MTAAVLVLLVLGQGLSLLHLAVHPHQLLASTGAIAHPIETPSKPACPPPKHKGADHDEGCPVFTALTQTSALSAPASQLPFAEPAGDLLGRLDSDLPLHHLDGLYLLSPAQSPPARG